MKDNSLEKTRQYWDAMITYAGHAAVIDPNDRIGLKNSYIASCHYQALFPVLKELPPYASILDFGCGTGFFLVSLQKIRPDLLGVGVDLSESMLGEAIRLHPQLTGQILAYDGERLPFSDCSIDALTCIGVLFYICQDSRLLAIVNEFRRILKPGGWVVAIDQVRRKSYADLQNYKVQRTPEQLVELFNQSGLSLKEWRQIRRGRFPLIYGIRYGWIPPRFHTIIAQLEARLWRNADVPLHDYADALFIWHTAN